MNKTTKTSLSKLTKTETEDLCAMIRVGRLANVIAFTRRAYLDADNLNKRLRDRQQVQATILLAGYLYEANYMLAELREPYGMTAYFSDLLVLSNVLSQFHEILTTFSFSPAFHQDWQPQRTLADLERSQIDIESLRMDCYLGHNPGHLHFRQIMMFDLDNCHDVLLDKFSVGKLCGFLASDLHELSDGFLRGANSFIDGLTKKMLAGKRRSKEARRFKAV